MTVQEFSVLPYHEQLHLINRSGKLKHASISNGYQYTVYKVKGLYVELKRNINELFFETITPMNPEDVPVTYLKRAQ